jgi:hypothetical protein
MRTPFEAAANALRTSAEIEHLPRVSIIVGARIISAFVSLF